MVEEADQVNEALAGHLRVAVATGAQIAERLARLREEAARTAAGRDRQAAVEVQARYDAERATARAHLAVVDRDDWWTHAAGGEIAAVQQTATAWAPHDDQAASAAERIRTEVRDRYGIDTTDHASTAAPTGAEAERASGGRRAEQVGMGEAQVLLQAADRADHAAIQRAAAVVAYDSDQRRDAFADRLTAAGVDPAAIQARILTNRGQAVSARDAAGQTTAGQLRSAPRMRGQQRDRDPLSR